MGSVDGVVVARPFTTYGGRDASLPSAHNAGARTADVDVAHTRHRRAPPVRRPIRATSDRGAPESRAASQLIRSDGHVVGIFTVTQAARPRGGSARYPFDGAVAPTSAAKQAAESEAWLCCFLVDRPAPVHPRDWCFVRVHGLLSFDRRQLWCSSQRRTFPDPSGRHSHGETHFHGDLRHHEALLFRVTWHGCEPTLTAAQRLAALRVREGKQAMERRLWRGDVVMTHARMDYTVASA
jgi:hypothetical protein